MTIRRRKRLDKGEVFSEGSRKLWIALQKRGWSLLQARTELGLAEGVLNKILYGDRRAGFRLAVILEKEFRIPLGDWAIPAKKDFALPQFLGAA